MADPLLMAVPACYCNQWHYNSSPGLSNRDMLFPDNNIFNNCWRFPAQKKTDSRKAALF
jgi:hypothetical protein